MAQLKDLNVDWISLVDKASVRDPQQKTEPRRFLLYKREGAVDKASTKEAQMVGTGLGIGLSASDRQAIEGLLGRLKAANESDDGTAVEKAMIDLSATRTQLAKSDVSPLLRERLEKADRELQVEYLCKHSGAYQGEHRQSLEALRMREAGRGLA